VGLGLPCEFKAFLGVSASNIKGKRELKNLEFSINFEALGSGSSQGKATKVG
jgi:hypothetical protein